jgi:hypothetical protein
MVPGKFPILPDIDEERRVARGKTCLQLPRRR